MKTCAKKKDVYQGSKIHADIRASGLLEKDAPLVGMYAKRGALVGAQQVADELCVRDAVSWTAFIAGYAQQGHGQEALGCFQQMRSQGFPPNAIIYASVLKACGIMQDVGMGKQIHDDIVNRGLLEKDIVLGNALVDMYAKCGVLLKAQQVFDELHVRDVISWTALIAGYVQHGRGQEALGCFHRMRSEGLSPDAVTYACVLKACGIMQDVGVGKQIHNDIVSQGLLKNNVVLGGALVDMYAKCAVLLKSQQAFDALPMRDAVTWNALIAGYAQQGQGRESLVCFQRMRSQGFSPDTITYACVLKACGIMQDVCTGKHIHDDIVSQGLLEKNVMLGNALVDMYAKCGLLLKAQQVFDALRVRDVISWTSLIAGYAQQGQGQEALVCFQRMRSQGFSPDAVMYACVLKTCGIMQDAGMGKQIHDDIVSQGLLERNIMLGNALVDMYAKCGVLLKAQQVFDALRVRDIISWTTLIAGYVQQGQGQEALGCFHRMRSEGLFPNVVSWTALIGGYVQLGLAKEALDCFEWMQQEGVSPNAVTFVNVLNACSHSGLIDEGQMYFDNMREKFGTPPNEEHFTCMVDLFARARLFDRAMRVIRMMPSSDYPPVWSALLGACRKWGNVKLGRLAFERAVQLDQRDAAPYALMGTIYAAAGMQDEADGDERKNC